MRKALLGIGLSTLLLLIAAAGAYVDPSPTGLKAEFFSGSGAAVPVHIATGVMPTGDSIRNAADRGIPQTFKATLTGLLIVLRDGEYAFALESDGTAAVFVDGQNAVTATAADGGRASARAVVNLERGRHGVFIQYDRGSGDIAFDLKWARDPGAAAPIPAWLFRPTGIGTWELGFSIVSNGLLIVAEWLWVISILAAVAVASGRAATRLKRALDRERLWRGLRWVLLGSLVLNATAVWWGLPAYWAPDELTPSTVFDALVQHFSHGWSDRYPPLHYYVLTAAMSPVMLLDALGRIDLYSGIWPLVLVLIGRMVSLAAGAGIVTIVAIVGQRAFGARAGVLGAAIFALAAPFVYYAKTANLDVPYLFWFALSLIAYLRLFDRGLMRDYVLFALFATLSIGTKDQAYGLYVLTPIVIGYHLYREGRDRGLGWRWMLDRRLVAGALTGVVVFVAVHNLVFNSDGFRQHLAFIVGPGSENYRTFPPTTEGRLALLVLSGHLVKISWGWPLTLVAVIGAGAALATPGRRWISLVLLTPAVSYYLTFINVILYNYDRFVLPICLVLAVFGGFLLDRILSSGSGHRWRVSLVAAVFAYTILYTATVDALMLGDGRYVVERWMTEHAVVSDVIGVSGPSELRPRLGGPSAEINRVPELETVRPGYYVLNADYARAVPADSDWGRLISGLQAGTLGYELAFRYRQPSPWPWLPDAHPDLVGPRPVRNDGKESSPFKASEAGVFSILRSVNPTIEVFRRRQALQPSDR